jgi:hypothetical protein
MKSLIILVILFSISFLSFSQTTKFKKHNPCSFTIELPSDMKLSKMYEEDSADYCDYEVRAADGLIIMELHSLLSSRFRFSTIKEAYQAALTNSKLKITYKFQSANFFVISGIDPENDNIFYWKRVMGEQFISDMHIEYDRSRRVLIESNIGKIAKSFRSN